MKKSQYHDGLSQPWAHKTFSKTSNFTVSLTNCLRIIFPDYRVFPLQLGPCKDFGRNTCGQSEGKSTDKGEGKG